MSRIQLIPYTIPFVNRYFTCPSSIVGIPIPRSISLPASHFTRTVMHDPVIKHFDYIELIMMMHYRVGPVIPCHSPSLGLACLCLHPCNMFKIPKKFEMGIAETLALNEIH